MRELICYWCLWVIFKLLPRDHCPSRRPRGSIRNTLRQIYTTRVIMGRKGYKFKQETDEGVTND